MSTKPLRVFIDTEFTGFDPFNDPNLISLGFVNENDERSIYIVIDSYREYETSEFVVETVLPIINKHDPKVLSRALAAQAINAFLDDVRSGDRSIPIQLMSDTEQIDWLLILGLFSKKIGDFAWVQEMNVAPRNIIGELHAGWIQELFFDQVEAFFLRRTFADSTGEDRHHALIDALANKAAWQVVQTEIGKL